MLENEHQILGLNKNASLPEIKQAYRRLSKKLHPDLNPSENAHQEFIALTLAYQKLVENQKVKSEPEFTISDEERLRRRTEKQAKKSYQDFKKSKFYKATSALNHIIDFATIIFMFLTIVVVPIALFITKGGKGLIIAAFVNLIFFPFIVGTIRQFRPKLRPKEFVVSTVFILKTRTFRHVLFAGIHLYVLVQIGFSTLLPFYHIIGLFVYGYAFGFIIQLFMKNKFWKRAWIFNIGPSFFSALLLINFLFSSKPVTEVYQFEHVYRETRHGEEMTTEIILECDAYEDYLGIKIFLDREDLKEASHIKYNFEEGLFGIRVLKKHEFIIDYKNQFEPIC